MVLVLINHFLLNAETYIYLLYPLYKQYKRFQNQCLKNFILSYKTMFNFNNTPSPFSVWSIRSNSPSLSYDLHFEKYLKIYIFSNNITKNNFIVLMRFHFKSDYCDGFEWIFELK